MVAAAAVVGERVVVVMAVKMVAAVQVEVVWEVAKAQEQTARVVVAAKVVAAKVAAEKVEAPEGLREVGGRVMEAVEVKARVMVVEAKGAGAQGVEMEVGMAVEVMEEEA